MSQQQKVRWGILGPGSIARAFAAGLAHAQSGELVALGARAPRRRRLRRHVDARDRRGVAALSAVAPTEEVRDRRGDVR